MAATDHRVFRALADRNRRRLLDALYERDGRTLTELVGELSMSRFGVMKHLRLLEAARLVLTRRAGRTKLHFLNAVPIRQLHDRWIDKYTEPMAAGLTRLKAHLETTMERIHEIYIKTTPERLWQAITDPDLRARFSFGVGAFSSWKPGAAFHGRTTALAHTPDVAICEGEIVEAEPPRRLVHTFRALWSDDVRGEGTSRVTWEITRIEDSCLLRVIHDQLREGANPQLYGGYPMILSGLKTLLETGGSLTTPASLQFLKPTSVA
jgi:uncharacterized protein YndB with AHSA1/START domain/DNA-binding transcriptional ArsR family regulator